LKSKALIIKGVGLSEIEEIQMPELKKNEILVKVKSCGVCTTDRRIFTGKIKVPTPMIGGHEAAGEVVKIGEKVKKVKEGDFVTLDTINRCGVCYYCVRGMDNLCINARKGRRIEEKFLIAGGFSEYAIVKEKQAFKLLKDTPLKVAALTEPLSCCLHSIKKADLQFGDSVLIIGGGTMGILHAFLAKKRGAKAVISDPEDKRRDFITKMGFKAIKPEEIEEILPEINEGFGFDAVFITAPVVDVVNKTIEYVRKVGTIVLYTSMHPTGDLNIDCNKIHYSEVKITGTEGRTIEDFRQATNLISSFYEDLKCLVTKTISLEELNDELSLIPAGHEQRTVVLF